MVYDSDSTLYGEWTSDPARDQHQSRSRLHQQCCFGHRVHRSRRNNVNYSYEWLFGGQVQSSYITSSLPSSATSEGEQWTVTPNDGIADGRGGEHLQQCPHTQWNVSIQLEPFITMMFYCSATANDADEVVNPPTNGQLRCCGTSTTLDLGAVGAMPDDVVTCTLFCRIATVCNG